MLSWWLAHGWVYFLIPWPCYLCSESPLLWLQGNWSFILWALRSPETCVNASFYKNVFFSFFFVSGVLFLIFLISAIMVSYRQALSTILGLRSILGMRKLWQPVLPIWLWWLSSMEQPSSSIFSQILSHCQARASGLYLLHHPYTQSQPLNLQSVIQKRWLELSGKSWEENYHNKLISVDNSIWLNGPCLQRDITVIDSGKIKQTGVTFL